MMSEYMADSMQTMVSHETKHRASDKMTQLLGKKSLSNFCGKIKRITSSISILSKHKDKIIECKACAKQFYLC